MVGKFPVPRKQQLQRMWTRSQGEIYNINDNINENRLVPLKVDIFLGTVFLSESWV